MYQKQKEFENRMNSLDSSYSNLKNKKENFELAKAKPLTWDELENLNSNFFISNRDDDFKPQDLIDPENESENEDDEQFGLLLERQKILEDIKQAEFKKNKKENSGMVKNTNQVKSSEEIHEKIQAKIRENTKFITDPNPQRQQIKQRESNSKAENRSKINNVMNEYIDIHKNDLVKNNNSVILSNMKDTERRARQFERETEQRRNKVEILIIKVIKMNEDNLNRGIERIKRYK